MEGPVPCVLEGLGCPKNKILGGGGGGQGTTMNGSLSNCSRTRVFEGRGGGDDKRPQRRNKFTFFFFLPFLLHDGNKSGGGVVCVGAPCKVIAHLLTLMSSLQALLLLKK